jgi:hypothetical protein
LIQIDIIYVVLHPSLRSHWFAVTVSPDDAAEAINTAEVIFKYVANSYLEKPTVMIPAPITAAQKVAQKPPVNRTPSFLASACSFQRPATVAITTISKRTPYEELADELTRYLSFEATSDELSAEDVLLNPLLWWKVRMSFNIYPIHIESP